MKRLAWLGAGLTCALLSSQVHAAEVEVLRQTGPVDKRFNIAVLGDGYRTEDQVLLRQNAQAIIDYVFGVSPLKQYAQLFNVKLVHVISNQNGADNGSYGASRDTALDAYFNCDGIDRLLCIDDGKTQLAAAADVPEFNFAIVLVNDPKYGGSGGPVCVSSSNEQSFEVLAHELGHSLAGLADEYSYEGNQPACDALLDCPEANVTVRKVREQIKWKAWIDAATPVPTPATSLYTNAPGLFEGARYTPLGVYRPQQDCKMRDLEAPYCAVCSEQFVRAIWSAENVQMIEGALPAQSSLVLRDCEPFELSVMSPPISPSTYAYAWSVDGAALPANTHTAELTPALVGPGEHEIVVTVSDATPLVRNDPDGLLRESFTWRVSVTRDDCSTNSGGSSGAGGSGGSAGDDAGLAGLGGEASESGGGSGDAGSSGASRGGSGGAAGAPMEKAGSAGLGGSSSVAGASNVAGSALDGDDPRGAPPPRDKASCGCTVPGSATQDFASMLGLAGSAVLLRRRQARRRAAHS